MEAEERISRHRNDRLTTVATFNNTRRWDPESVEARRQMWVQELESRKDRRDQQVKERVQVRGGAVVEQRHVGMEGVVSPTMHCTMLRLPAARNGTGAGAQHVKGPDVVVQAAKRGAHGTR